MILLAQNTNQWAALFKKIMKLLVLCKTYNVLIT